MYHTETNYTHTWLSVVMHMHAKDLTLWRPVVPHGYSYKASYARPG